MYPFRNTYRKADKVYVEDRGFLYEIGEQSVEFNEVHSKFKDMLSVDQTAVKSGDEWEVVDGYFIVEAYKDYWARHWREERDRKLEATDYLMMPDYPVSGELKARLVEYRQALRDLPEQEGWPLEVEMPENPLDAR